MFKVIMTIKDEEAVRGWNLIREIEMPYIPHTGMTIAPGKESNALTVTEVRYIIDSGKTVVELQGDLFRVLCTFLGNEGKWKIEGAQSFEKDKEAQKELTHIKMTRNK